MTVEAGNERDARAGNGSFESFGLRDDEIRRDSAVRPAANTQLVGIRNALRNGIVHHGHVILIILVAPIGVNRSAELLAVAGGPARIRKQNGVAARSIK